MKKTKFPAFLSTAIVCYIFWLLLTGELISLINGNFAVKDIEILIAGAVVSICVALFASRFFIHEKAFYLFNPVKFFIMLFYSLIIFMWELIKANWDVAMRALRPGKLKINPGIVKIPTGLKSEYGLSMLANSITLTPGTITMDIADEGEGDAKQTNYYIHWIDVDQALIDGYADPEKAAETSAQAGDAIKGTMEKWIRRIWG